MYNFINAKIIWIMVNLEDDHKCDYICEKYVIHFSTLFCEYPFYLYLSELDTKYVLDIFVSSLACL